MKRLWAFFFTERPYGCGCGKTFRDETRLSKHLWAHEGFKI